MKLKQLYKLDQIFGSTPWTLTIYHTLAPSRLFPLSIFVFSFIAYLLSGLLAFLLCDLVSVRSDGHSRLMQTSDRKCWMNVKRHSYCHQRGIFLFSSLLLSTLTWQKEVQGQPLYRLSVPPSSFIIILFFLICFYAFFSFQAIVSCFQLENMEGTISKWVFLNSHWSLNLTLHFILKCICFDACQPQRAHLTTVWHPFPQIVCNKLLQWCISAIKGKGKALRKGFVYWCLLLLDCCPFTAVCLCLYGTPRLCIKGYMGEGKTT